MNKNDTIVASIGLILLIGTLCLGVWITNNTNGFKKPIDDTCCVCKCCMENCPTDTIQSL